MVSTREPPIGQELTGKPVFTKKYVNDLKIGNSLEFYSLFKERNTAKIIFLLENLGHLPSHFEGDCLVPLLNNGDDRVRYLAANSI